MFGVTTAPTPVIAGAGFPEHGSAPIPKNSGEEILFMGKHTEMPRYNVVSMRVTDEERESLLATAKELSISISEMLRRSLQHVNVKSESLQLQRSI